MRSTISSPISKLRTVDGFLFIALSTSDVKVGEGGY